MKNSGRCGPPGFKSKKEGHKVNESEKRKLGFLLVVIVIVSAIGISYVVALSTQSPDTEPNPPSDCIIWQDTGLYYAQLPNSTVLHNASANILITLLLNYLLQSGGGTLYIKSGIYLINDWIYPQGFGSLHNANISINGEGGATIRAMLDFPRDRMMLFLRWRGLIVQGLKFESVNVNVRAIHVGGCEDVIIQNNIFNNTCPSANDWALLIGLYGYSKNIIVLNNIFKGRYTGGIGWCDGVSVCIQNNIIETDYFGIDLEKSGDSLKRIIVLGNIISNATPGGQPIGIEIATGQNLVNNSPGENMVIIADNILRNAGLMIYRTSNVDVHDNTIYNATEARSGGIKLEGAKYCHIHDNTIVRSLFGIQEINYIFSVPIDYSDYNVFENNIIHNCTTPISKVGAHDIIRMNVGYCTENSGTANIVTSILVTFPHGLAGTPTHVTCGFKTLSYGSWAWIANSTTITITVAYAGSYTFSWFTEFKP